ncbi:hypothetical protein [Billgrantia montanilacus]|uniref:hypothetical protein n=1 Tax=Billgrantia montanilacus TaxID=2282305 RepID=UPI0011C05860|nr:hypothetical protein [Halomonas montanilacus]
MHYLIVLLAALSYPAFSGEREWYLGDWRIVEARFPGVTAMTDQEAAAWVGLDIHYSNNSVELKNEICNAPAYESNSVPPVDFMGRNMSTLETLEINTSMVELIEVDCTPSWMGPGFTIIKRDDHSGYIFWDGAYFLIIKKN